LDWTSRITPKTTARIRTAKIIVDDIVPVQPGFTGDNYLARGEAIYVMV